MSARVSRSFSLSSPLKVEEGSSMAVAKQGIVTILGSDTQLNKAASLRRTLSADMSSKKWLAQNGFFSPMKRIASSEEIAIPDHHSSEGEKEEEEERLDMPGQDEVWRLIQSQEEKKSELEKPAQLNAWSSILTEKSSNDTNNVPPPYIHPLVKRSGSTLSEKSLEICTESLGSETGFDGCFPSHPPSESGDFEEDKEESTQQQQHQQQQEKDPRGQESFEELRVEKYNYNPSKRMAPKTFPPPLPSLAGGKGPSLHMHSHRKNGRLVLEAVSVLEKNYFHAERQEGRLLLSLINNPFSQEPDQEEVEDEVRKLGEVFDNFDEVEKNEVAVDGEEYDYSDEEEAEEEEMDQEEEEVEKQIGIKDMTFMIDQSSSLPSGVINLHGSALMMKRLMRMHNKDPTWSNKLNKTVNLMEVEEVMEGLTQPIPQSLPPPQLVARLITASSPTTTVAASFNAYEYFWRNRNTMASIITPIKQQCTPQKEEKNDLSNSNSIKAYKQQDLVLIRGCKDSRKSLLIWQPDCIATS